MRRYQRRATRLEEDNQDFQLKRKTQKHEFGYLDSRSDTFGVGGDAWKIDEKSDRTVTVVGFDMRKQSRKMSRLERQ